MHGGCDAVRRVHDGRALGHFGLLVDEYGAPCLEIAHDVDVVNDLLADVDGGAVVIEGLLDRLDGALDPRAVAARRCQEDSFDHTDRVSVRRFAGVARRSDAGGIARAGALSVASVSRALLLRAGTVRSHDREPVGSVSMIDRVALFVTCLADTLFPNAGKATVTVLERLGIEVVFPPDQTCCGQMHGNSGYPAEATALARRFVDVFDGFDAIVTPSGSCAAQVREHFGDLLGGDDRGVPGRTWELSQFLTGVLGLEDVGSTFAGTVAYHPTCHSLRLLRVGDAPLRLLRAVPGVELHELPDAEECCGFGGTFAVKNADVSTAMLDEKIAAITASGAENVCACDSSCLMHIGGGLRRRGVPVRPIHLAEILAS